MYDFVSSFLYILNVRYGMMHYIIKKIEICVVWRIS